MKKENYGCVEITEFQLACQIKITPKIPKILINNILIRLIGIKTLNFIPIQLKLYINNEVTINLNVIFFNNRNILITIINYDIKINLFNYFSII